MTKVYVGDKGDYWFVDSCLNILTFKVIVSREEMDSYKGFGFLPQIKANEIIKQEKEKLKDFNVLGYEDEDVKLGYQRTVTLARIGHFRYVSAENKT